MPNANRRNVSRRGGRPAPDDLRPEYDFSRAKHSPYAARYAAGTNIVLLAPDVVELFPNSEAVNEALRACARIIRTQGRKPRGKTRRKVALR